MPWIAQSILDPCSNPSGVVRAGDGAADDHDLRLDLKYRVKGPRPKSAGKRDPEASTAYIQNSVDMCG